MSANNTQVNGSHYVSQYQVWDLIADMDLGYFEGNIVKYVTRHRQKGGAVDLAKAIHYTEKLRELALRHGRAPQHRFMSNVRLDEFQRGNSLSSLERACVLSACSWDHTRDLDLLVDRIKCVIRECYPPLGASDVHDHQTQAFIEATKKLCSPTDPFDGDAVKKLAHAEHLAKYQQEGMAQVGKRVTVLNWPKLNW